MADLSDMLSELLNSPDGMSKIQAAAASLGITPGNDAPDGPPPENDAGPGPDLSALGGLGDLGDLSMITKLLPLMSDMKSEDENTVLLKALRPYLQAERQERLDQSIKIMRLLKLLPLLRDGGGLL